MATIVKPEVATYQQYIDGEWVDAAEGETYEILNPSNEEVMAAAAAGSREDARRAVAAARRSFEAGDWRLKSQGSRGRIHWIRSGSTPASSSQLQVSIAVLPAPITVKPVGGASRSASWLGDTRRAPAATA